MDTIVAQATPPGRGGIGVVRISGPATPAIAQAILGKLPEPRVAHLVTFRDADQQAIDSGLALYFKAPNSFTGEDVLELQGHGGDVVMSMLINCCLTLGARLARPGEFSERAFLNDKIDLSQAEAIADLIDSMSESAARTAMRSLTGEFSRRIHELVETVTHLRMYIEAAIDFPEDEIDFLADEQVQSLLSSAQSQLQETLAQSTSGAILREGINLLLIGAPNAGKSSLMNQLTGQDTSIVTEVAGTTRDVVDEYIHLDGIPLRLLDTAGIRDSGDQVEIEGVRRTRAQIDSADHVLLVVDVTESGFEHVTATLKAEVPAGKSLTLVLNKADIGPRDLQVPEGGILVSALTGEGMDSLRSAIKSHLGYTPQEGMFMARGRHLDALRRADASLSAAATALTDLQAGELVAEDLKIVQSALGEITGQVTSDDLLGRIFSSFCIGK